MVMADKKKSREEMLERVMSHLADSVLALPDESILAEAGDPGADLNQDAEHVRLVLSGASQVLEDITRRLSNMGHAINSNYWHRDHWGFHTKCLNCGSSVSFTTATREAQGGALDAPCSASNEYRIPRRASR
jgi:hypothetical protein